MCLREVQVCEGRMTNNKEKLEIVVLFVHFYVSRGKMRKGYAEKKLDTVDMQD